MKIEKLSRGFTLTELLVVVAVIGILAGLVSANVSSAKDKARDAERRNDLTVLKGAVELFANVAGHPPGESNRCYHSTEPLAASNPQWIPDLGSQYVNPMPTDPRQPTEPGFAYTYCRGGVGQAQAYYLTAPLEAKAEPTLATAPSGHLDRPDSFVTGVYEGPDGAKVYITSSGPVVVN